MKFNDSWGVWTMLYLAVTGICVNTEAMAVEENLFDLDVVQVLNLEITSVSKKPQTLSQSAAAVYVITSDDIRHSGASSIADILRLAPGVQVAQISANSWAVSARGFDGRFTNKLLVLMDGRSVYSPTFSGVYWDVQDTLLEDIERIEIIRGPGAALWGANAVNGVINIITKSALATQGGLVSAMFGGQNDGTLAARYGGRLGQIGAWRAYVKGFDRAASWVADTGNTHSNREGDDKWRAKRVGFRADIAPDAANALTIQGDIYEGRSQETSVVNTYTSPYNQWQSSSQKVSGGNLLARWQNELSATDSITLQGLFDVTRRDWPWHMAEERNTADIDIQYRSQRFNGHDIVAGLAYRTSHDNIKAPTVNSSINNAQVFASFPTQSVGSNLTSLFVQDDISLLPKLWVLTLGAKVESGGYGKRVETQPNIRMLWTPSETTSAWASIAKAVRTPSRFESDNGTIYPAGGILGPTNSLNLLGRLGQPLVLYTNGSAGRETLIAYEAGIKQRFNTNFFADLSVFYNDYDNLRSYRRGTLICPQGYAAFLTGQVNCTEANQTYFSQPILAMNLGQAKSYGAELALNWRIVEQLRFNFNLSAMHIKVSLPPGDDVSDRAGSTPKIQAGMRMVWTPRADIDFAAQWRYVGALSQPADGVSTPEYVRPIKIAAYNELDLRLAWRARKDLELALVGRNLLRTRHSEFVSELADVPLMQPQRTLAAQAIWRF